MFHDKVWRACSTEQQHQRSNEVIAGALPVTPPSPSPFSQAYPTSTPTRTNVPCRAPDRSCLALIIRLALIRAGVCVAHWAPRTRKRHPQGHRPQRPTESNDPTQHAKGRTGDCPGPRKETTTRRNVTRGGGSRSRRAEPHPLPGTRKSTWFARKQSGAPLSSRPSNASRLAKPIHVDISDDDAEPDTGRDQVATPTDIKTEINVGEAARSNAAPPHRLALPPPLPFGGVLPVPLASPALAETKNSLSSPGWG